MSIAIGQARADITSGSSSGYGISSTLVLTPLGVNVANANLAVGANGGMAPMAYGSTTSFTGSFSTGAITSSIGNLPLGNVLSGTTGTSSTAVSSNITGTAASGSASAVTTISNLNLNVLGLLSLPELTVGATTLTSSSTASGMYGALVGTGTPTLSNLSVKVLGLEIGTLLTPGALVTVSDLASLPGLSGLSALTGLKIGLDISSTTPTGGVGTTNMSVVTDNLVISFSNVATLSGTINGTLDIGHSQAVIAASVPEPASMAMTGVGLAVVGFVARVRGRRRRTGVAA